jgi:glycolate oxidase iron-sulfur subunit
MKTEFAPILLDEPHNAASEAEIRRCVRCGFCTATCPTYVLLGDELDSPRGRIYLIKEMLETQAEPSPEVITHIDRCLSCLSCKTTCPSGVDYKKLIDHARAYVEQHGKRPLLDRVYRGLLAFVLPKPWRFRAALSLAGPVKPAADFFRDARALKPLAAMLDLAPARLQRAGGPAVARPAKLRGRVVMLGGCAEPVLRPQIQASARRLFARMGLEVVAASTPSSPRRRAAAPASRPMATCSPTIHAMRRRPPRSAPSPATSSRSWRPSACRAPTRLDR